MSIPRAIAPRGLWPVPLACALLCAAQVLAGEPMPRPVLIGVLTGGFGPLPQVAGLQDGLSELGYRQYEDYVLGVRFTNGDRSQLEQAARALVRDGANILFTFSNEGVKAAQRATRRVPIVFAAAGGDLVSTGLIESYARPGGNVTGVSSSYHDLAAKQVELLAGLIPDLRRIRFVYRRGDTDHEQTIAALHRAAAALDLIPAVHPVTDAAELAAVVGDGQVEPGDGFLSPGNLWLDIPGTLLDLTTRRGIPVMFFWDWYVEHGALASYGPPILGAGRDAARHVAKIMEGADPAALPVEVQSDLRFVVNLKTAKALGIEIPPEVLFQADRIIR